MKNSQDKLIENQLERSVKTEFAEYDKSGLRHVDERIEFIISGNGGK